MDYRYHDIFPNDHEVKKTILEIGRRMYAKNFVASNDGNISAKVSENTIWCTPTGVSKGYMTDEMLVLMDLDGNVLKGSYNPSSEIRMHLRVYRENPAVGAVVHAHPPAATSYAIAGMPLNRAVLTEAVMGIGEIPIAPYAMPGTEEVPNSIAPFVNTHNGCLLANHGALTWGKDAMEAWMRMESVEYYALVCMYTNGLIGQMNELTCDQVDRLIERRTNSGITTGGRPLCRNCGADGVPACVALGSPAAVHAAACSCGSSGTSGGGNAGVLSGDGRGAMAVNYVSGNAGVLAGDGAGSNFTGYISSNANVAGNGRPGMPGGQALAPSMRSGGAPLPAVWREPTPAQKSAFSPVENSFLTAPPLEGEILKLVTEADINDAYRDNRGQVYCEEKGTILVAFDAVGAGEGEVVMIVSGSSSRQTVLTDNKPSDTAIIAIIDYIDLYHKRIFSKEKDYREVDS